jgi:hypothetical protein
MGVVAPVGSQFDDDGTLRFKSVLKRIVGTADSLHGWCGEVARHDSNASFETLVNP